MAQLTLERAMIRAGKIYEIGEHTDLSQEEFEDLFYTQNGVKYADEDTESLPIADYDSLTVDEVSSAAADLSDEERQQVLGYEQAHKNRKTVVESLGATVAS